MMKIQTRSIIDKLKYILIFGCISVAGCVTVPPVDKITSIESVLPRTPTAIQPQEPVTRVEQIDRPQTLSSKIDYINTCLINYSWGRGWTDKTQFSN
jgi:hypothetical protein